MAWEARRCRVAGESWAAAWHSVEVEGAGRGREACRSTDVGDEGRPRRRRGATWTHGGGGLEGAARAIEGLPKTRERLRERWGIAELWIVG